MNNTNQPFTPFTPVSATKANKARTNLLLLAQKEVIHFKKNNTKINSKSLTEQIAEYESIEIVITNPVEMGNAMPKNSYDQSDFIFNQTCSVVELKLSEEITKFVENFNRTVFSERKLLKRQKNDQDDYNDNNNNNNNNNNNANVNGDESRKKNIRRLKRTTSEEIAKKENISLMKKYCHYLRKLCFSYIKKKRDRRRKTLTHQPKMTPEDMARLNNSDKAKRNNLRYSFKGIDSDIINAKLDYDGTNSTNGGNGCDGSSYIDKNGKVRTKQNNSSNMLPTEKSKGKIGKILNSFNENVKSNYFRRKSEEYNNRSAFFQRHSYNRTQTTECDKPHVEIVEDDNDNEDTVDDYNELRQMNCNNNNNDISKQVVTKSNSNSSTHSNHDDIERNRKYSEKDPVLSIRFTKGVF